MTWANLASAFAYGSSPTSTQLQNLRDNLAALAAADSGAPTFKKASLKSSCMTTAKFAADSVTRSKLKTSTGSVSGSLSSTNPNDSISLQSYCFGVNAGGSLAALLWTYPGIVASDVAKFAISCDWGGTYWPMDYAFYYRYVTASDRPFVYAIQDADGKFTGVWESDDPPPDYWGLDKKPTGFRPPLIKMDKNCKIITPHKEIVIFNADKEFFSEIRNKAGVDKKSFAQVLNGYDFLDNKFEPKTILEV